MRFLKSGMACGLALAAFAVAAIAMFASVRTNEDIKLSIGTVRQGTVTPTATYSGSVDFGQSWDLLSPSNGKVYSIRKATFYANLAVLESKGYIEVSDVPRGKVARLTLKGELLTTQINTFLTDYYKRIFKQFNLKAVI